MDIKVLLSIGNSQSMTIGHCYLLFYCKHCSQVIYILNYDVQRFYCLFNVHIN